ncbi:allergin-1 isoform X2 [Arvicola amphibius]|uniref:allergin-1 isoform X2 n=1 Tax=Arvicola amphibius TaxID=1047088 RepID=UPI0018E3ACFC|nr:allergin-1 isoform X2 [Arvicola amphibius]
MGAGGSPMCLSLASFKGMKSWLDRLLLWAIFLSTALQNAAVDCKRVRANELPSPNLNSSMTVVSMDQNVSLSCSSKNTSVDITYSLFLGRKHLQTKISGETVTFYLKIFNANETGPYKCKTNDSSGAKYSQEFSFTIARKARTESESKGSGDAPMQGELYANVCETQTEAGQPQELHYATPVFKEVAPREQEGHAGNKADYVYSDLTY